MAVFHYGDRRVRLPTAQSKVDESFQWADNDKVKALSDSLSITSFSRSLLARWRHGQDHRCTVNVPFRTNPDIQPYHRTIFHDQTTLEDWEGARPYVFHFVGAGDDYPYVISQKQSVHRLLEVWNGTAELLPRDQLFFVNDRISSENFSRSIVQSRFCLVMRGDDPMRSRFFDALSAGCIPLLISDGFRDFGIGYGTKLHNYDAFTISIPESYWLVHAPAALRSAVTMPRAELRTMHSRLMEARPKLLMDVDNDGDGGNDSVAAEYIFRALNERCKLDETELRNYDSRTTQDGRRQRWGRRKSRRVKGQRPSEL
jgi:hypothetical protein